MIVDKLNLLRAGDAPFETDAKLVILADGPLPLPILSQLMKPVSRRVSQIRYIDGRIQHLKLAPGAFQNIAWKALGPIPAKHLLRPAILE